MGGDIDNEEAQHPELWALREENQRLRQQLEAAGPDSWTEDVEVLDSWLLTSAAAHDLNHLLAVIRPSLDLLHGHVSADAVGLLRDATTAAERASRLVGQLMAFAGKRRAKRVGRPFRLAKAISEAVALAHHSLPDTMTVSTRNAEIGLRANCNPQELSEVLVELILNARDAMLADETPAPRIDVEVELAPADLDFTESGMPVGPKARISVSDNGPAMSNEECRQALDPSSATTAPARGAGLGWAISWSVIRANRGLLRCQSQPGRGVRFEIYLPIATEVPARPGLPRQTEERASTALRILLVEDDEHVRRVTKRALTRAKHTVMEADSAKRALALTRDQGFDVILLDQWLPDGCGTDCIPSLKEASPHCKIVLFTGQDFDDANLGHADALIAKPIGAKELLGTLAELIKRRTG